MTKTLLSPARIRKQTKIRWNNPERGENMPFTVRVGVDRNLNARELLKAAKIIPCGDISVIDTAPLMPGQGKEEVNYVFFNVGEALADSRVMEQRNRNRLTRDLAAQIQANAARQMIAKNCFNGDCWQGTDGKWRFVVFYICPVNSRIYVRAGLSQSGWFKDSWFGGRESAG